VSDTGDIAIITDSTSDLPPGLCEEYGITVVPLSVTIGDETFQDGTLSMEEFFERMNAQPTLPTTSQPPVGAFVEAYERALESASHVVSIHISNKLSGTFSSAKTASESFGDKVRVVDTYNLSWGLGLQVLEAAKAAASGAGVDSVVETVTNLRDRVQLIVGLDTMDNIVKGGRLSKTAGKLGGMLNVKLTIEVKDGEIVLSRVTRGSRAALDYGLKWIDSHMGDTKRGVFCVMHALSLERAEWLRDALEERYDVEEMHFVETGTVIATHTGTGWGVALLPLD
jgi:DegV family protein with EDD domain